MLGWMLLLLLLKMAMALFAQRCGRATERASV